MFSEPLIISKEIQNQSWRTAFGSELQIDGNGHSWGYLMRILGNPEQIGESSGTHGAWGGWRIHPGERRSVRNFRWEGFSVQRHLVFVVCFFKKLQCHYSSVMKTSLQPEVVLEFLEK